MIRRNNRVIRIEYFIEKPKGNGPFPVIFMIHGYEPKENSIGGKMFEKMGYLSLFAENGIVGVSISVPGFGNSKGKRDFCGRYEESVGKGSSHFPG